MDIFLMIITGALIATALSVLNIQSGSFIWWILVFLLNALAVFVYSSAGWLG